jgi:hemolysin III
MAWASASTSAVCCSVELLDGLGVVAVGVVGAGGILYSAGAVIYAWKRPDPAPTVFGYHELFHLLVILGAALQYTVVAVCVL